MAGLNGAGSSAAGLTGAMPLAARRIARAAPVLGARVAADLVAERDRWFLWATALFGTGVAIYYALPGEPRLLAVLAVLGAAAALPLAWREGLAATVVCGAVVAVAAGFAAAKLRTEAAGGPVLARALYNTEVRGWVELVEPRDGRGVRLTVRVRELGRLPAEARPVRVRVRTATGGAAFRPGDAVRLTATLAAPALPALPGDYDFARAAWFKQIGAVGYAVKRPERDPDAEVAPVDLRFWSAIETLRQGIGERIRAVLPGETGAIAAALINGERGGISEATNDAYRASGIYHMLSISGLHMVIMAGAAFWLVRFALALFPAIALRWPIAKIAAVAATFAALGYLLISGGATATTRSWLMITIGFLAVLADRPAIALRTVAISALLMLAVFPESLLDVGFQMSFAAVVALVAAYEVIRDRIDQRAGAPGYGPIVRTLLFFGGILLSTLIAGFAVAPFSAYHFHQSQQYAMLTNLAVMPLCNLVVMPAALASLLAMPFGLEAGPLWVMGAGIDLITATAYHVAAIPGATVYVPAIPDIAFLLMVFGGLWLCLWRRRWRLAGLVAIAAGMALSPFKPRADVVVGQDAALVAVRGPDGTLVAPPSRTPAFEFKRWREHDGNPVIRGAPAETSPVFRCDVAGCVAAVAGRKVALARHPSALRDDCRLADIVVVPWPRPRSCAPRIAVIDLYAVRDLGTHTIRLHDAGAVIQTVQDTRGTRPWTGAARWQRPDSDRRSPSRLAAFATPEVAADEPWQPRPEIEDDDPPDDTGRSPLPKAQ